MSTGEWKIIKICLQAGSKLPIIDIFLPFCSSKLPLLEKRKIFYADYPKDMKLKLYRHFPT